MALSAEQARHTENVFHIALRRGETHVEHYAVRERQLNFFGQLFDQFLMKFGYKNSKMV